MKICRAQLALWLGFNLFFSCVMPELFTPVRAGLFFLLGGSAVVLSNIARVIIERRCARSEEDAIASWQLSLFLLYFILFQTAFLVFSKVHPEPPGMILAASFMAALLQAVLPWIAAIMTMPPEE